MKLKLKKSYEQEVELTPPLFWKQDESFNPYIVGFLNYNTVIRFCGRSEYVSIVNTTPEVGNILEDAFNKYLPITEEEFFSAYDDAYEALRLHPKQITTDNIADHEAHQDLKQAANY